MTLRDFLDEAKFGAAGHLCIAICGEDDYLDNFEQGMYWELPAGNWENGSESTTKPLMPEEILFARVIEVECAPDVPKMYEKVGRFGSENYHHTVIVVAEPYDFDAEAYWTEDKLHKPISYGDWPYNISRELWYEIQAAVPNVGYRMMALNNLLHIGINTSKNLTDEEIERHRIDDSQLGENQFITVRPDEILRATRTIAQKLDGCDLHAIMALYELEDMGYAFNKRM